MGGDAVHWAVFKDFGKERTISSELDKLNLPKDLRLKLAQFDPTDFKVCRGRSCACVSRD